MPLSSRRPSGETEIILMTSGSSRTGSRLSSSRSKRRARFLLIIAVLRPLPLPPARASGAGWGVLWMLSWGEWRREGVGDGRTAGFHLSSLYSPVGWFSWADAAKQFVQAQKNPALLQVFVNTVLGQTWALQGEAPEWQRLYDRSIFQSVNEPGNEL